MNRLGVILVVGATLITGGAALRGAQLIDQRMAHIETALGINPENPDGQMYDAFKGIMGALKHMHDEMEENNENVRPLTEEQRTYETQLESARN